MRRRPAFTRSERIELLLVGEVERLLAFELKSPLSADVHVSAAHLAGDLGHMRVDWALRSSDDASPRHQEMLDRAASFVGRTLQDIYGLRKRPTVVFRFDQEYVRARRVQAVLAAEGGDAVDGDEAINDGWNSDDSGESGGADYDALTKSPAAPGAATSDSGGREA